MGLKENEISAAPELLTVERVAHWVITADALHTKALLPAHPAARRRLGLDRQRQPPHHARRPGPLL